MTLEDFKNTLSGIGLKHYQDEEKEYIFVGYATIFSDQKLPICIYNKIEESAKVIHHKFSKFLQDEKEVWNVEDNPEELPTEFRNAKNFRDALLNEFKIVRSVNADSLESRRTGKV